MVKVDDSVAVEAPGLTAEEVKKLYNMGYRNFIAGDYSEAADALQEVCRFNAATYGEKGDECGDALLLYGRCLLELGRAENCVLGNALKGWSQIEYDSQENLSSEQFEDPEKVSADERAKLREEVTEAMAEPDTIEEETEKTEEKTDQKSEEKKDEAPTESMETDEKPEAAGEEKKAEEPEKAANGDAKAEEKPETEKMEEETPKTDEEKAVEKEKEIAEGDKMEEEKPVEKESEKKETVESKEEEPSTEQDSMAEDPDSIPSLQLAWEMIELARVIYKQRAESVERDVKISECYLRLGEVGMEIENYTGAIGDFLECQVLQKKHFDDLDRRIAETHYHLGAAYAFQKRHDNAKEHFGQARKMILDKIDALTEKFDNETEKEASPKILNDLTNEIAQLKDILPDLNSKLEDIESSLKEETFNKVSEHLTKDKTSESTPAAKDAPKETGNIQHLVKRKQEELEKMESVEKKAKVAAE